MRDRLIELLNKKYDHFCDQCGVNKDSHYTESLADYLLENGVIVPPCKVGDVIFFVDMVCNEEGEEELGMSIGKVVSFSIQKEGLWMYCRYEDGLTYWHLVDDELGKTVFLTKEEAEKALRKEQNNE